MASKLGDEKSSIDPISTRRAILVISKDDVVTITATSYRHHHWSGGKFENASENAG